MKYKTELRARANISKISKEDISDSLDIMENYNQADRFKPSEKMVEAAKRGLTSIEEGSAGGTKLRISTAKDIVNGNSLSINAVKRLNKFFEKQEDVVSTEDTASWDLYGGEEGKTWASEILQKEEMRAKASAELDPDLLKMRSILVSQGMNLNDDVFLKDELVRARLTGANKPVNIEHEDTEIIGHMLSTFAVAKDGTILEDLEDINLEDEIDIVNEAVVYSYIFPEVAARIQELASRNELFVSVEAWFSDYDYLLGDQIVKRTEATSTVLEKHLRINGGDGEYEDKKVGRVLRNIMFGGVGVVATPANPESLILEVGDVENAMASEEVVLASHVIGEYKELNDFGEAQKEENMDEKVEKNELVHSEDESNLELVEQHEESAESTDENSNVTASENDSTEESVEETVDVSSEDQEVVEASSPEDVDGETEIEAEDTTDSIEASEQEVDESEVEQEVAEAEHTDYESADANLDGAHEHPEIMTRIDELMAAMTRMTDMMSSQNDIIGALDDKVVLLQSEALIDQRRKDMIEAGLSSDLVSSRLDKVVSMSKEEFDSYLEDIKGIVQAQSNDAEEDIDNKEVEQDKTVASADETEDSEIDLDNIEPTSAEINVEGSVEDNDTFNKFYKVLSNKFNKRR